MDRAQYNLVGPVLVVDEDEASTAALRAQLSRLGVWRVDVAHSLCEAQGLLQRGYSLLFVEALFPHGEDCRRLVEAAFRVRSPMPVVVMSADADRSLVAELVFAGISAYLEKPIGGCELEACLACLSDHLGMCKRAARMLVGRLGLKEAQWYLRGTMSGEALARANGSIRAAASMLQIDRRYLARLADEFRDSQFRPG